MRKKFDSIVFRNYFNNGDLHCARSFIKYISTTLREYLYKLNHPRSEKTLADLNIPLYWKSHQIPRTFDNRGYHVEYNTLFINTQYLAYDGMYFNKYSCTPFTLWHIFNRTLQENFGIELPKDIKLFLPEINYHCGKYEIDKVDEMLSRADFPVRVLICNNEFESEQGLRFNMDRMIEVLANTYPNYLFLTTNATNAVCDGSNLFRVDKIIGDCNGNNLNEISYLSTKCHIILGRLSGPNTFCFVKENMMNTNKKFITFCPPSPLYGMNTDMWTDYGSHVYLAKYQRAQFYNITETDERKRYTQICELMGV